MPDLNDWLDFPPPPQFILAKGDSTYLSPSTDMQFTFGLSVLPP